MIVCMRCLSTLVTGLVCMLSTAQSVVAQVPDRPGPPPQSTPLGAYIAAFVLFGLVSFAAWKSSKRTHQD